MKHTFVATVVMSLGMLPALAMGQQVIPGQQQLQGGQQQQPQGGQLQGGQLQGGQAAQQQQLPGGQLQGGQPGQQQLGQQGQIPGQQRFSQQPQAGQPGMQQGQGGQQQGGQQNDMVLAAWLMGGNRAEVELGQLASQRAKSDDVKKFAEQMVQAHTQLLSQLQGVAGPLGQQDPRSSAVGASNSGQRMGPQGQTAGTQMAGSQMGDQMAGGGINLLQLHEQIGQQCLAGKKSELEAKPADHFDKAYVGSQIGAHMEMLATLKVARGQASPQFQQALDQATQTTQQHLDHAKMLMKTLENDKS